MFHKDSFKKKLVTAHLAYDFLSLINLRVECNLPTIRYNTGYPNELLRVKKRICTLHFSFAI